MTSNFRSGHAGAQEIVQAFDTLDEEGRFDRIRAIVLADPGRALELGQDLVVAGSSKEQVLGAEILGQIADLDERTRHRVAQVLLDSFAATSEPVALAAAALALGHTRDPAARDRLLELAEHVDPSVRFGVATSLTQVGLDSRAMMALQRLSRDPDSDVRDWATFALAETDDDDAETVGALLERAGDSDYDTRCEAIYGLARRRHPLAAQLVRSEIASGMTSALLERAQSLLEEGGE